MISFIPTPFLTCAKIVGPPSLILPASRSITPKSAPTISAKSVLFTINRSDCVIPGPPLRGILSPPETSISQVSLINIQRQGIGDRGNYDVNDIIGEFTRVVCCEIVTARFNEEDLCFKESLQVLQDMKIGRNIFSNRCVWARSLTQSVTSFQLTSTSFHSTNTLMWQRVVTDQEFSILYTSAPPSEDSYLLSEDVVRQCRNVILGIQSPTQSQHQCRFPYNQPHSLKILPEPTGLTSVKSKRERGIPSDSHGKGSLTPISAQFNGPFSVDVGSCILPDFMGMTMSPIFVGMGMRLPAVFMRV